jgi:hypothetical protein
MGNVAYMREMRNAYKISVRRPEENRHFEDLDTDGRIIVKWKL